MASSAERNGLRSSFIGLWGRNWGAEQTAVLICLTVLCALSWLSLLFLTDIMRMPQMAGMEMAPQPWSLADFGIRFAMWITMMAGMMLPSALPMILLFQRVVGQLPHVFGRVLLFTLAYLSIWSGFSLLATLLQQGLEHLAWLSPMAMRSVPWLGGLLLIMAGVYQWLPAKQACLSHCSAPFGFLLRYPVRTWQDSWRLGIAHGGYCLGCCWALMLVLFSVGVMNLLWVASLAGFVLLEKLVPGRWLARMAGSILVAWGLAVWLQAV